jgi:hypothetical protein
MIKYGEYGRASAVALDKYHAALETDETNAALSRLKEAKDFSQSAAAQLQDATKLLKQFSDQLPPLDATSIEKARKIVSESGLPPEIIETYREMGFERMMPAIQEEMMTAPVQVASVSLVEYFQALEGSLTRQTEIIESEFNHLQEITNKPQDLTQYVLGAASVTVLLIAAVILIRKTRQRRGKAMLNADTSVRVIAGQERTADQEYCTFCGTSITTSDSFCSNCGRRRGQEEDWQTILLQWNALSRCLDASFG